MNHSMPPLPPAFRAAALAEIARISRPSRLPEMPPPVVPGYTSRGARLLQSVMARHGFGPAFVNVPPPPAA